MLRQIGSTAVAGGIARLFTLVIPFAAVRVFGIGEDTDAFFLAAAVILFWTMSVAPVLETGIIAEFVREPRRSGWSRILHLGIRFSVLAAGVGALVGAALWLAPERLVEASLAGRTGQILLELSPLLVISIWSSLLAGWLNARHHFRSVAVSPAILGVSVLASLYAFAPHLGIHALVIGYLAGECLRLAYLGGRVLWTQPQETAPPSDTGRSGPETRRRGLDVMTLQWLCLVLIALNPVVDRLLAGSLQVGSISALELIERLVMIPVGLVTWAVLPVVTARLAHASEAPHEFSRLLRRILLLAVAAGALVALFLAAVHGWIFQLLLTGGRDAWPENGDLAFLCLVAGLPFQICALLLWRVAVILNQPGWIFGFSGVLAFATNLMIDLIAINWWGLPALTFSTSATFLLLSGMFWKFSLHKGPEKGIPVASGSN